MNEKGNEDDITAVLSMTTPLYYSAFNDYTGCRVKLETYL